MAGGGTLLDIGVHLLDMSLFLMNNFQPQTVSGVTYSKFGPRGLGEGDWGQSDRGEMRFDVEDFATALIKLKGGASVMLEVSWAGHQETPYLQQLHLFRYRCRASPLYPSTPHIPAPARWRLFDDRAPAGFGCVPRVLPLPQLDRRDIGHRPAAMPDRTIAGGADDFGCDLRIGKHWERSPHRSGWHRRKAGPIKSICLYRPRRDLQVADTNGSSTTFPLCIAPSAGMINSLPAGINAFFTNPRQIAALESTGEIVLLVMPPT